LLPHVFIHLASATALASLAQSSAITSAWSAVAATARGRADDIAITSADRGSCWLGDLASVGHAKNHQSEHQGEEAAQKPKFIHRLGFVN
jgi:hypothetical protein